MGEKREGKGLISVNERERGADHEKEKRRRNVHE